MNIAGPSHRVIAYVPTLCAGGTIHAAASCLIAPDQRETNLELPPADTKRWASRRKAAVVVATRTGVLSRMEACRRYMLSDEELADWEVALDRRGIPGLRSSSLHLYRAGSKPFEESVPVRERG
jgi:hypothetical protein